nr:unnamed protein product [Spirometra erinaceieuropaei]
MAHLEIPRWLTILHIYLRYIFIIIYPIILSPILILHPGTESKAAYILLLMSGFWVSGFIPLYVTALLPLVLGPLMGLIPSAVIAKEYSSSSTFLFLGGMLLAIAAENMNLHRRIAVAFVRWMGHDPRLLILSVMLPTWFLSMWMSNTATTVMMVTIVEALLTKLDDVIAAPPEGTDPNEATEAFFKCGRSKKSNPLDDFQEEFYEDPASAKSTDKLEELERAAEQEDNEEISFDIVAIVKKISEEERRVLGPMKFGEIACTILFLLLIGLWITREPGVPGWSRFMPVSNDSNGKIVRYVDDTQPTILFAILAFIVPASNPFRLRADPDETGK